ncbi:MAG: hypothetical protein KIT14_23060 [bacterium]|nr:hypothetical protein [bacterium]
MKAAALAAEARVPQPERPSRSACREHGTQSLFDESPQRDALALRQSFRFLEKRRRDVERGLDTATHIRGS